MLGLLWGCLPPLAAVAMIMAIGWKAQRGARNSRYQSMSAYGREAQLLQDKADLHRLGLAQLLSRQWRGIAAFGLSFNTMAMIGSAALLFGPALAAGGPSVVGIGLPLIALLSLPVSAALAELMSATPTAGGVYHAAWAIGGRRNAIRTGWLHAGGQIAMLALLAGGCAAFADMLLSARLGYEQSSLTFCLLAMALACTLVLANLLGSQFRQWLSTAGVWLQLLLAAGLLAGLAWFFWPGDYPPVALYVFRDIGWSASAPPEGLLLGTLLMLKLFTGADGAAQGAEETVEPRLNVPWSIFLSTAYVFVFAYVLLLFMTLTLPSALQSAPGFDAVALGAAGSGWFIAGASAGWGGALLPVILITVSMWFSAVQAAGACSRSLFALGRDDAVPFSRVLSAVSVSRQLPAGALFCATVLALFLLVGFVLASKEPFLLPLLSLGIAGLQLAYAIPIGLRLREGANLPAMQGEGPWHLGNWSRPIQIAAFVWLVISATLTMTFIHTAGGIGVAALLLGATLTDAKPGRRGDKRIGPASSKKGKDLAEMEKRYPVA